MHKMLQDTARRLEKQRVEFPFLTADFIIQRFEPRFDSEPEVRLRNTLSPLLPHLLYTHHTGAPFFFFTTMVCKEHSI